MSVEPDAVNEPLRVVDEFDAFYRAEYRPLLKLAFWTALRDLPERQCQVVALHYIEDRSIAEIADGSDITVPLA